jgi:hypothetical protein
VYSYSADVGTVLKSVKGPSATYQLTGDEIYVRARVISKAPHPNPFGKRDVKMAWTKPLVPSMAAR